MSHTARHGVSVRDLALYGGLVLVLALLGFVLPDYHHGNLSRIMVLACFAMGYNIAFGYTGLLSLGHAMFFAAGLYGAGLSVQALGWSAELGLVVGLVAAAALALAVGLLALRTTGVSFMIVTLMFSQAGYLAVLYFGDYTRGDEGFVRLVLRFDGDAASLAVRIDRRHLDLLTAARVEDLFLRLDHDRLDRAFAWSLELSAF